MVFLYVPLCIWLLSLSLSLSVSFLLPGYLHEFPDILEQNPSFVFKATMLRQEIYQESPSLNTWYHHICKLYGYFSFSSWSYHDNFQIWQSFKYSLQTQKPSKNFLFELVSSGLGALVSSFKHIQGDFLVVPTRTFGSLVPCHFLHQFYSKLHRKIAISNLLFHLSFLVLVTFCILVFDLDDVNVFMVGC